VRFSGRCSAIIFSAVICFTSLSSSHAAPSVARQWNEELLEAIRKDFARPTVHARNLWHASIAMWDAWAIYDETASPYLTFEPAPIVANIEAAREETLSFACYRVLSARFATSPGAAMTLPRLDALMDSLGFNRANTSTVGRTPAALGNRIAVNILHRGLNDGSNEQNGYAINNGYLPINPPLVVEGATSEEIVDPNRWQPLALDFFIDQSGHPLPQSVQTFLGPHWGQLPPFAMTSDEIGPLHVYLNPGPPPHIGGIGDAEYKDMFADNARLQSVMTPLNGLTIDISPSAHGNNPLGTNDGTGHQDNPMTGEPYPPNIVPLGDWARCIAEFWADGPDSETPPGHWNTLANYVSDYPGFQKRIGGVGPVVNDLEWDVKVYLAVNGAVYDAAVAAWGCKGFYDYVRPISAIRHMCQQGQSSSPEALSYNPNGILLEPGIIEVITPENSAAGQPLNHLRFNIGEIAILSWPGVPTNPETQFGGVRWRLGKNWLPYQRDTFVTPPFAGYVSGHSTFSRAAAEVLTGITGSAFFPGGLGSQLCAQNEFLVFEDGPSVDVTLQWATYYDASDEASISRLYGGIHPRADDFPGRIMGSVIGMQAWNRAQDYYAGTTSPLVGGQGVQLR
jgi:hypothetical protein